MPYCLGYGAGLRSLLVRGSVIRRREFAFFSESAVFGETAQPITDITDFVATDVKGFVSRGASSEPDRATERNRGVLCGGCHRCGSRWSGPTQGAAAHSRSHGATAAPRQFS